MGFTGRLRALLIGGLAGANLFVFALAGYSLHQSRQQYEMRARTQTQNIAYAIDQSVSNSIGKVDLVLQATVDELERQLAGGSVNPGAMTAFIDRQEARLPELEAIRVADASGLVILGKGLNKAERATWSDRDYFVFLRDNPDGGLQISKPRKGRVAKKYIVGFARRYNKPDGSFAGVVSAPIALDHFTGLLASFDLGPRGTAILRDTDLGLVTRHPPIPDQPAGMVGNPSVSAEFRALVASGETAATYFTPQGADHTERIGSFRHLSGGPMIVIAAMAKEDYLADWRAEIVKTALLAVSFTLLSLLSAIFLLGLLNRIVRESAKNRLYLQRAGDGIHILDEKGDLVEASDSFAAMLGYSRKELKGMNLTQWDARWPAEILLGEILPQKLAQEGTSTLETQHRRKDGTIIDVEVTVAAFAMDGSRFIYAASRDIGERKRAEAALREAMQKAEAANVAKSQFLATMSHEIRTPMNGILGMAQLLMAQNLTETERADYVRTILNSGQTLLTLLNDILDLSKVDAGKLELTQAAFDPAQLLTDTAALYGEAAHQKGLALDFVWQGPAGQRYRGDPVRLRQMLSNLVSNAIKFTDRGGIRIEATETERTEGSARLRFRVADTGIGIPDDKRHLLFQPFTQLDGSSTRQYGGTGLGLSIVRRLADLMGGSVEVDSAPGRGATFGFAVPAEIVPAGEDSRRTERRDRSPARPAPTAAAPRILVVEDNAVNRRVIEAILAKRGYTVQSAADGREAVAAATRADGRPDLVLMDCQMPEMSGFEATERIRAWEREQDQPRLPIVALTAGAFPEDRDRCFAAGMDDFLAKPVDIEQLQDTLGRCLGA
ncbi:two-component system, sensor histidine kinase and response regulator [Rhodocyclaceae bacterium]|nr:two-component system, sensor histidine kinase and response regulator [Rhodocyclaceae bacterium]